MPIAAAWDGVGSFQFGASGDDLTVEWQVCHRGRKSALLSELCCSPDREGDRQELGNLIADVIGQSADREMQLIPGYGDGEKYTSPLRRQERDWRHWAAVPAGPMNFGERAKRARAVNRARES
jgi:hypothetical protein